MIILAKRLVATQSVKPLLNRFLMPAMRYRFCNFNLEKYEFKCEPKQMLNFITNSSVYLDKDVFLRELLSNASDALEKQSFLARQKIYIGKKQELQKFRIETSKDLNIFTIEDNGIGMTKQEMIDNLGTIGRSGTKQFFDQNPNMQKDTIIGQFGIGLYTCFNLGTVSVISQTEDGKQAYEWKSDGSASYTISDSFRPNGRGTTVKLYLKPEYAEFCDGDVIESTIKKYHKHFQFHLLMNGFLTQLISKGQQISKTGISQYRKMSETDARLIQEKLSLLLSPTVSQVIIQGELTDSPAWVTSPKLYQVKKGESYQEEELQLTLVINSHHEFIHGLLEAVKNQFDGVDLLIKSLLDYCLLTAGMLTDREGIIERIHKLSTLVLKNTNAGYQASPNEDLPQQTQQKQPDSFSITQVMLVGKNNELLENKTVRVQYEYGDGEGEK